MLSGVTALGGDNNPWFGTAYFHDAANADAFRHAAIEHVELTVVSVAIGFVVSLALALFIRRFAWSEGIVLALADTVYAVPSIALFSLLLPLTGLSLAGPIIGLSAYTLLILVRNILEGLRGVPPEAVEAASGIGFGALRRLVRVELPLALPAIFAGLRVATVSTVGLVTVAFELSHGGLGEVLTVGYSNNLYRQPVIDAVIGIVVIALVLDVLLQLAQRLATPWLRARAAR